MTTETALLVGRALTYYLKTSQKLSHNPKIVIGKDTRLSGDMLTQAVAAGIMSQGGDVFEAGTLPTPGLANLTLSLRANAGVVISASHNPSEDNGLKIFDSQGFKLHDEIEYLIEQFMEDPKLLNNSRPAPPNIGRARPIPDATGRYIVSLKSSFPKNLSLEGLKIVLDCACGAAYACAPLVFEELGADVKVIDALPNGLNINLGVGALHPEVCAQEVLKSHADLGVALDGDADRAIFIDSRGKIVDGDQILFLCAVHLNKKRKLKNNAMAATIMSNMALEIALLHEGIKLFRTQVGDRYVAECLLREDLNFGGEKSGHLIFLDHATTGDGTLAALQTLALMKESGTSLETLETLMVPFPQILINVKAQNPTKIMLDPDVKSLLAECHARLNNKGRLILRPSGTEPLIRIMVEGQNETEITNLANDCASKLKSIVKTSSFH
jgi:phosphoglucosamine mutase